MKRCVLLLIGSLVLAAACQSAPTPLPKPTALPPTETRMPAPPLAVATLPPPLVTRASVYVGKLDRTYWYYIPATLPRNAPLVFVLHMNHQDVADIRSMTEYAFERLADQNGFITVYPDGYSSAWNDCRKYGSPVAIADVNDGDFIRAMIGRFSADYAIDTSRVFVVGIANGGMLALRLALEIPSEITAVTAVAASLPIDTNSVCRASGKPIPVLMINGTSDAITLYKGNPLGFLSVPAIAEYFARVNGQTRTPTTTRLPHRDPQDPTFVNQLTWNEPGKPEVILYSIDGGGGVLPLGKFTTVTFLTNLGQATGDLDGPSAIWDFFSRQHRD